MYVGNVGRRTRRRLGAPTLLLPSLDLNFMTGSLPSGVTFARTSTAWAFDATGALVSVAAGTPRFDYDPATLQLRGLLIEAARTNLILGSAAPVTQNCTVTATSYALSFYGTGSITLSGTATGTLTGTSDTVRSVLVFTPTAGTLTVTITGTVKWCNLEASTFASSPIITTGATVTRTAETASMTDMTWFNAATGTFLAETMLQSINTALPMHILSANDGTNNERHTLRFASSTGAFQYVVVDGAATQANIGPTGTPPLNTALKTAYAYTANDFAGCRTGNATVATDSAGTLPTVDRLQLGYQTAGEHLNGHLRRVQYWQTRRSNADLQSLVA